LLDEEGGRFPPFQRLLHFEPPPSSFRAMQQPLPYLKPTNNNAAVLTRGIRINIESSAMGPQAHQFAVAADGDAAPPVPNSIYSEMMVIWKMFHFMFNIVVELVGALKSAALFERPDTPQIRNNLTLLSDTRPMQRRVPKKTDYNFEYKQQ
jgi:hypothetical protein